MRLIFCRKTSIPDEDLSSKVYNNKKMTAEKATAKKNFFKRTRRNYNPRATVRYFFHEIISKR
jgi:hypothetical protein